jgi:TolB-like protein/DNA-binding winged helix-turn-helix (wHTH) protein/Flp pilus assembly protein TadD
MARQFQFGEFTLDESRYKLQRGDRLLRLQKRPMDLLLLLVERRGELVSRDEIAEHLWGKDVFLDVDHSINTAIRKVRQALRDDPEKPRYVETVVGKGYRFAAPVICKNGDASPRVELETFPSPVQAASEPAVPCEERQQVSSRVWIVIGATVFLAVLAVAVVLYPGRSAKPTDQPPIKSLAVLPLKNLSGDPNQEYLADGMTEALIGRLSGIHDLRVVSRTSVMGFKETKLSVPEIAKSLDVDAIVEGSLIRDGNHVRVYVQLIRAEDDEHFWAQEYDRELQNVLVLQSDVAQSIAKKVEASVTGQERARLVAARPVAPEVYELYVKARNVPENNKVQLEQRIANFQDAIRKDPTFAPAYVGLAQTYIGYQDMAVGANPSEIRPKATEAARKAIELDPELAEAHAILAEMYQKQWKWAEAEAEYKRALELKPNDASAHRGYAYWLACQGRTEEAVAWVKRGRELDPLGSLDSVGFILLMARRYEESIREYRSLVAAHPHYTNARWGLGFALIMNNQIDEAISELEKTVAMMDASPASIAMLATAYGLASNRAEALRLIAELKQPRGKGYIPSGAFITPYLALGDYDQAFLWFEEAYKEQSAILQWIKVTPLFDPVRGDARFLDLQRRVGLN